jgi:hypothetical protein
MDGYGYRQTDRYLCRGTDRQMDTQSDRLLFFLFNAARFNETHPKSSGLLQREPEKNQS